MFAASVSQYRTLSFSYINLSRRFQYALQGYSQTQFFYGQQHGRALRSGVFGLHRSRRRASRRGRRAAARPSASIRSIATARLELSAGFVQLQRGVQRPDLEAGSRTSISRSTYGATLFRNGTFMPLGVDVHPGNHRVPRVRAAGRQHGAARLRGRAEHGEPAVAPDRRRRRAVLPAARHERRCWRCALAGFKSWGEVPDFMYFGGNSEMRGYEYLEFLGQNAFFANAELRFPLIEAMLTPIGVIGGIRGVFFFNIGGAGFDSDAIDEGLATQRDDDLHPAVIGFELDPLSPTGRTRAGLRRPDSRSTASGCVDGRASYGIGLETFALGFPIHFDWSWRTLFNKEWEECVFAAVRRQRSELRASRSSRSGSATTSRPRLARRTRTCYVSCQTGSVTREACARAGGPSGGLRGATACRRRSTRTSSGTSRPAARCITQLHDLRVHRSHSCAPSHEEDLPVRAALDVDCARSIDAATIPTATSPACEASVGIGDRDGAGRPAERREPARVHPGRHGDAPHRHRRARSPATGTRAACS